MISSLSLGQIGQISRSVSNIAVSTLWYRDVLGLPLLYSFDGMAFFDCGGVRLYLQQQAEAESESVLYFQVSDILQAHAELSDRGVSFAKPPHMIHRHPDGVEEWMAFFNDPDGRLLALIAQRRAGT